MRWLPHPWLSLMLAVLWCALNVSLHPAHLSLALLLGIGVPLLLREHLPGLPRLRRPSAALRLLGRFLVDLWRANWQMAHLVLSGRQPRSEWVHVPLTLRNPSARMLLGSMITLTPGTLTAALSPEGNALLVHALDVSNAAQLTSDVQQRYESLLLAILGESA